MRLTLAVNIYLTYNLQMFTFVKNRLWLLLFFFASIGHSQLYYCGTSFVEGPTLKPEQIISRTFGDPKGNRKIILLHGMDAHGGAWKPLIQTMEKDTDVTLFVPNLRGHGNTPDFGDDYHLWSMAREMGEWAKRVSPDAKVDIVGHSLGGRLGLAMVYLFPDLVKSLTIIDLSVGSFNSYEMRKALRKLKNPNAIGSEPMSAGHKMMLQSWLEDLYPVIIETKIPLLFVGGGSEGMLTPYDEAQLKEVKPTGVTVKWIPEADHLLHRTHPEELRELLRVFWNTNGT